MSIVDLQKYWTDHSVVTDQMVIDLKEELKIKPYEGLMIVKNENHVKAFNEPIPEGFVAWLIVDKRIPKITQATHKVKSFIYTYTYIFLTSSGLFISKYTFTQMNFILSPLF